MPHIALADGLPGILGPLTFRPETAEHLLGLAEVLLRGDSSLTRGERELIAAHVSSTNRCEFCAKSHAAAAAWQMDDGFEVAAKVVAGEVPASVGPKVEALLAIAAAVAESGAAVRPEHIDAARAAGATDIEIHDTVLIAAAFCMFNRYVDGLATVRPSDDEEYVRMGKRLADEGYARPR